MCEKQEMIRFWW